MKTLVTSFISLLVGAAIGYYIGYRYCDKHVLGPAVDLMVQGGESSDGEKAARAIRAIKFIDSGETQKAIQLLSGPIVEYYYIYSIDTGVNKERRLKMRAVIEQLVSTNKIVAEEMENQRTNYETPGKLK